MRKKYTDIAFLDKKVLINLFLSEKTNMVYEKNIMLRYS